MFGQNPSPLDAQILAELGITNLYNYHQAVPNALFRSYLDTVAGVTSISGLGAITSLNLSGLSLDDMSGIEYGDSLTSLIVSGNKLTALDIANLTGMVTLFTNSNVLTSSDVANLTNLVTLNHGVNLLTSIDVSNLTKLELFYIYSNQFEQAELETVVDDLWANRAALGALSCDIQLQNNPGSIATSTSKASAISDLIAAGCSVTIL